MLKFIHIKKLLKRSSLSSRKMHICSRSKPIFSSTSSSQEAHCQMMKELSRLLPLSTDPPNLKVQVLARQSVLNRCARTFLNRLEVLALFRGQGLDSLSPP